MIREATIEDLDAIAKVEKSAFEKGAWPKKAILSEFTENELSRIYVDVEDGEVVAWLDFMITFTSATVMAIGVKPEYRKRGIATSLMKKMEEICHAAMFLAENTYVTGIALNCSGGALMP